MRIITNTIEISTKGYNDVVDVTPQVGAVLRDSSVRNGQVTVFVPGSTAGVTTIEYEPGLLKDIPDAMEKVAPMNMVYHHDAAWGDGNGYAHVRAAFIGASFTAPIEAGRILLGTWQQIVIIDFDNRPRQRRIVVQIIGE
jgi:secondary thiamine-phosphate synthase enzyme